MIYEGVTVPQQRRALKLGSGELRKSVVRFCWFLRNYVSQADVSPLESSPQAAAGRTA
jgi:hypothetical protein